jgi:hypothetical protein
MVYFVVVKSNCIELAICANPPCNIPDLMPKLNWVFVIASGICISNFDVRSKMIHDSFAGSPLEIASVGTFLVSHGKESCWYGLSQESQFIPIRLNFHDPSVLDGHLAISDVPSLFAALIIYKIEHFHFSLWFWIKKPDSIRQRWNGYPG